MLELGFEEETAKGHILRTCGTKRKITLKEGTEVTLLPVIIDNQYTSRTSKSDIRQKRCSLRAIEILEALYGKYFNNTFPSTIMEGRLTVSAWAQKGNQEFPIAL